MMMCLVTVDTMSTAACQRLGDGIWSNRHTSLTHVLLFPRVLRSSVVSTEAIDSGRIEADLRSSLLLTVLASPSRLLHEASLVNNCAEVAGDEIASQVAERGEIADDRPRLVDVVLGQVCEETYALFRAFKNQFPKPSHMWPRSEAASASGASTSHSSRHAHRRFPGLTASPAMFVATHPWPSAPLKPKLDTPVPLVYS